MAEDEKIFAGIISKPGVTQEQADHMHAILGPIAKVILDLSEDDLINVMGGLCITYALRYDEPIPAFIALADSVLKAIPEAIAQLIVAKSPN